jgi:hypothetical protein
MTSGAAHDGVPQTVILFLPRIVNQVHFGFLPVTSSIALLRPKSPTFTFQSLSTRRLWHLRSLNQLIECEGVGVPMDNIIGM